MRLGHHILGSSITCSHNPHKAKYWLPSTLPPTIKSFHTRARVRILPFPRASFPSVTVPSALGPRRTKMSLASALAITYNTTVGAPLNPLTSPEDVGSKSHHLKSGGFKNPWDRYVLLWLSDETRDMAQGTPESWSYGLFQLSTDHSGFFKMAPINRNCHGHVEVSTHILGRFVGVTHI